MKSNLKVSKLQSTLSKIENQLRQEKVEKKVHQQQIKKIQGDLLTIDSKENKGEVTQNILAEK